MSRRGLALAGLAGLAGLVALTGCGYRPVRDAVGVADGERLGVVLVSSTVPDAAASDEVVAGVREELARVAALSAGSGYPRCEIEVLRADEASEGIGAVDSSSTPGGVSAESRLVPGARATRVGLVARAWIVRTKDGPRERDTGDVRAVETVGVAPDARAATFRHHDALRAAGRRTGRALALRLLGLPSASDGI